MIFCGKSVKNQRQVNVLYDFFYFLKLFKVGPGGWMSIESNDISAPVKIGVKAKFWPENHASSLSPLHLL